MLSIAGLRVLDWWPKPSSYPQETQKNHIPRHRKHIASVKRLSTPAWLLRGISSIPGELRLSSGRLSFTCSGTGSAWRFQLRKLGELLGQESFAQSLEEGKPFQLFHWPADQIQTVIPWYYFGGGIKLQYQKEQLRFSFGRPASGSRNIAAAAAELNEIGAMRSRGKLWEKALSAAAAGKPGDA